MSSLASQLARDIRSMPRTVWVLLIGQFINRFGAFVFPFFTLILSERGMGAGQIAIVLAAMSVGHLTGPIASGYLADAIGRKNTILVSLFGSAISVLALYVCHDLWTVTAAAATNGFLFFLYGPASSALLTDLVPERQRVTAFALMRLAINGGFAAGPTVAGLLYARLPVLIFLGDALTTIIFGVIAWRWLPHGLRTIEGKVTSARVAIRSWVEAIADMKRNLPYLQFLAVVLLIGLAFYQVFNVLVITATDRGLTPSTYGLVMGLNGVLILLTELPLTAWVQRFSTRKVLATGYALIGVGCGLFGLASSFSGFLAAMAVFTFGEILALPLGMAYSSGLAPERFRGRYFGFRGMAWGMAGIFGSVGIWAYGQIGAHWWLLVAASSFAATITILPKLADRRISCGLSPDLSHSADPAETS